MICCIDIKEVDILIRCLFVFRKQYFSGIHFLTECYCRHDHIQMCKVHYRTGTCVEDIGL